MIQTAQTFNTTLFLAISGLHFYWAFGILMGKKMKSVSEVLPEMEGKPLFTPGAFATFIVAIGLVFFAIISGFGLLEIDIFKIFKPIFLYGNLLIAIIFMARAIGDFRYVGFFKKNKTSKFAINDSKYYSPLCLLISILAFTIYWGT
jgi:hypothetical protein